MYITLQEVVLDKINFLFAGHLKTNKIQIKKDEIAMSIIKELTNLYIPKVTGLRNLLKQGKTSAS